MPADLCNVHPESDDCHHSRDLDILPKAISLMLARPGRDLHFYDRAFPIGRLQVSIDLQKSLSAVSLQCRGCPGTWLCR